MTRTDDNPDPQHEPKPVEDRAPAPAFDRGISPIAGRFGGRNSKLITLAALGLGCGVFLFATWDRGDADGRKTAAPDDPARQMMPFEPARREAEAPQLSELADPAAPMLNTTEDAIPALEAHAASGNGASAPSPAEKRRALIESAQRAPVIAYSRQGVSDALAASRNQTAPAPGGVPGMGDARVTPLDSLRHTSAIGQARAGRLPDRHLLLTAGSSIPCILQTAMDSATPGFVSCILPTDVYSESGSVVLMERGTRVLGEYQAGLQQGRSRLFVVWTRAVTPTGVAVALASPASDALGRAGFDGTINSHFWDRFGGALLLSLVDDGLYAAVDRDEALQNSARVPSDAAGVALQHSVAIPATLRKTQGSEVSIFVAQDLTFASVYRLGLR